MRKKVTDDDGLLFIDKPSPELYHKIAEARRTHACDEWEMRIYYMPIRAGQLDSITISIYLLKISHYA